VANTDQSVLAALLIAQRALTEDLRTVKAGIRNAAEIYKAIGAAMIDSPERVRFDGAPDEFQFGDTALMKEPEAFDWYSFPDKAVVAGLLTFFHATRKELKLVEAKIKRLQPDRTEAATE
jgi:hypothetical protein